MNETIQAALAPLAAFWIALEGFIKAANFVNGMRDTIILGVLGTSQLSFHHRQAIFTDWQLSVVGFISAGIMFSFIVFSLSGLAPRATIGIYAVALNTFLGAVLFLICSVSDYRAIRHALRQVESSELGSVNELGSGS
jgi:hypothetical protein